MLARKLMVSGLVFGLLSGVCFGQAPFDFDKAEYVKPAAAGSKKGETVDGSLRFDAAKKEVQFVDKKGSPAVDIKYDAIKSMLYEKTAKPRYAAGLLLAWPLLFTKSKKHYQVRCIPVVRRFISGLHPFVTSPTARQAWSMAPSV